MKFAQRTDWELSRNSISRKLDSVRSSGATVLDLTQSNPTSCQFEILSEALLRPFCDQRNFVYEPSARGLEEARETVCNYYGQRGVRVEPVQVFLTASTSEAYSFLFRLLANPGDEVLFPTPSYPLFDFLTSLNDVRMKPYLLAYAERWQMNLSECEAFLAERPSAITCVHPNNPTGSYLSSTEQQSLNRLCRQYQVPIICDEVFYEYCFLDEPPPSFAGNKDVLTFTLGGLSKWLGLPQMKLAWIVVNGPAEQVEAAVVRLEVIADTFLSVNTPVQRSLGAWSLLQEQLHVPIFNRVKKNIQGLEKLLEGDPQVKLLNTEGGWYAVMSLPEWVREERFVLTLLSEEHVYVHPGYFYDLSQAASAVVSLLPPEELLMEGVARILKKVRKGGD